MLVYDFEEVRDFFCGSVFRMSEHTGAIIEKTEDMAELPHPNEDFRISKWVFHCHAVTPKYVIGTFTTAD